MMPPEFADSYLGWRLKFLPPWEAGSSLKPCSPRPSLYKYSRSAMAEASFLPSCCLSWFDPRIHLSLDFIQTMRPKHLASSFFVLVVHPKRVAVSVTVVESSSLPRGCASMSRMEAVSARRKMKRGEAPLENTAPPANAAFSALLTSSPRPGVKSSNPTVSASDPDSGISVLDRVPIAQLGVQSIRSLAAGDQGDSARSPSPLSHRSCPPVPRA
jgi:hypothetical protein